jgi:hypothetical protein
LIDFEIPKYADELQKVIISILKENGFQFKNAHDIWDLFFILGQENQFDLIKIDKLLQEHQDFKKLDVDFGLYK